MGYFVDRSGIYYEGDRQADDEEVPRRPTPLYRWIGGEWVLDPEKQRAEIRVQLDVLNGPDKWRKGQRELSIEVIRDAAPKRAAELSEETGQQVTADQVLQTHKMYQLLLAEDQHVAELERQLEALGG